MTIQLSDKCEQKVMSLRAKWLALESTRDPSLAAKAKDDAATKAMAVALRAFKEGGRTQELANAYARAQTEHDIAHAEMDAAIGASREMMRAFVDEFPSTFTLVLVELIGDEAARAVRGDRTMTDENISEEDAAIRAALT
jgi:hypothetical protein